jgi:hypothetical protein
LPPETDINVALVVVGEAVPGEGPVGTLGFVEHRNVRFDALFVDQPVEHLSRTIAVSAARRSGVMIEA